MIFLKRAFFILLVLLIGIFSSCQYLAPIDLDPVNTPLAPTMTPDPCNSENLSDEMEVIRSSFTEFQELTFIANNSRPEDLIEPVLRLEEIRTRIINLPLPGCLRKLQAKFSEYSGSVISYLSERMKDPKSDAYLIEQKNSETLWQAVEDEYEKAILTVTNQFIPITGSGNAFAEKSNFVLAFNDGTKSVNIRVNDDLDSAVIGQLDPGMQALVVGKNDDASWLRINMPGVYGWVFFEMVELTGSLEDIPVITHN